MELPLRSSRNHTCECQRVRSDAYNLPLWPPAAVVVQKQDVRSANRYGRSREFKEFRPAGRWITAHGVDGELGRDFSANRRPFECLRGLKPEMIGDVGEMRHG